MSAFTSTMAASWSGVSWYGNASSNSRCHGVSPSNAWPSLCSRFWYSTTSSCAISTTAARTRALVRCHPSPPSRLSDGASPPV